MNMAISDSFQRAIASIPRRRRLLLGLGVQAAIPLASLYLALLLRLDLDASRIDHSIYCVSAGATDPKDLGPMLPMGGGGCCGGGCGCGH